MDTTDAFHILRSSASVIESPFQLLTFQSWPCYLYLTSCLHLYTCRLKTQLKSLGDIEYATCYKVFTMFAPFMWCYRYVVRYIKQCNHEFVIYLNNWTQDRLCIWKLLCSISLDFISVSGVVVVGMGLGARNKFGAPVQISPSCAAPEHMVRGALIQWHHMHTQYLYHR